MDLLHAAAYEIRGRRCAGKIHAIKENERTYCGTDRRYTDGVIAEGQRAAITCKGCIRSLDAADNAEQQRQESERVRQEWEQRRAERDEQRQQENAEWWAWYSAYLTTPRWHRKRQLVLERAHGLCQGCRENPPVHVHHTTYEHAGNELLFELVALCRGCHQIAHPGKVI
jgi:hypothetical protein